MCEVSPYGKPRRAGFLCSFGREMVGRLPALPTIFHRSFVASPLLASTITVNDFPLESSKGAAADDGLAHALHFAPLLLLLYPFLFSQLESASGVVSRPAVSADGEGQHEESTRPADK